MKKDVLIDEKTRLSLTTNNLYAILFATVLVAASWFNISTRVDLLSQKVDLLITNQEAIIKSLDERLSATEARQRDGLSRLAVLETKVQNIEKTERR